MGESCPWLWVMLYVVALRQFGAAGAAMIWRPSTRGSIARIGDSPRADLRLVGAGDAAELFCDGTSWSVRTPTAGIRAVGDGASFVAGEWTILTLLGRDDDLVDGEAADDDAPFFGIGDAAVAVADGLPALLGSATWCSLRLERIGLPVAAVARARGGRIALYPVPGVAASRSDRRFRGPIELADGDDLRFGARGAPLVRFTDPREALDRLLGEIGGASPAPVPDRRSFVGEEGVVSLAEAVLWAIGAAAALGYVGLVAVRW